MTLLVVDIFSQIAVMLSRMKINFSVVYQKFSDLSAFWFTAITAIKSANWSQRLAAIEIFTVENLIRINCGIEVRQRIVLRTGAFGFGACR
ncbi:MAG: hypothetical protein R3289_14375 [Photobacterium sp.]|nr:hypothetical protein [Photobacterium sp.]